MKIWTLMENSSCRSDLVAEHGLSLYMEIGNRKILFDTGKTEAFADNADKMGIDLAAVDTAILSHGHFDHGGGIAAFLRRNSHAPLYLSRHAFGTHYGIMGKFIGLDPALKAQKQLIFTEDVQDLGDGLCLYSCNERVRPCPTNPRGLHFELDGTLLPEDFRHEQYLLVEEAGKRILISGCSHKGIENLVHWFHPDILVGGFHLKDVDPDAPELEQVARVLLEYPTVYYTGHCTGAAQYKKLKQLMGDRLHYLPTGKILEI